jgi:outer membrane protein TolC
MKRTIFIIISLFIYASAFSQETHTLKELLETGFQNSKDLKISNSKVVSSSAKIDEIISQFFPQLTFNAGYTRLSDVPAFEVSIPNIPQPIKLYDMILDNYSMKLSLQQPLFTGFRLSSLKNSSEFLNNASELDLQKDKNELALNIQIAYWNYYKTKLLKLYIDDIVKTNEIHLEDTKNLMYSGLATQNDVLKLELALSNAKLQQIDAQNNIELARISLNKAIGISITETTEIEITDIDTSGISLNLTALINEAKDKRAELKSTEYKISAARENIAATRSTYFPSISLIGDYYFSQPNSRYQPPLNQFKGSWDVGVNLNWSLWNWGNTSSQVIQAEQNLIQTQTSLEQIKENIEVEVNQNYLNLKYSKDKLSVASLGIVQAKENLRITEEKYKVQLATSTDLVDAQNSFLLATTNYTNALVDFQISKVKFDKSLGRRIY